MQQAAPQVESAAPSSSAEVTPAEAALDAAFAVSPGGLLVARPARPELAVPSRDPRRFVVRTAWHEFSGDLAQGLVLQAVRGPGGTPGAPICHSGNMLQLRRSWRRRTFDMEAAIVDYGLRRLPGRVVLFHESHVSLRRGLRRRLRPAVRVRYDYAIQAASPVLELTVTVTAERGGWLRNLRLTTALDAMSPEGGAAAIRRAVVFGPGGRTAIPPRGKGGKARLHRGPAGHVIFPEERDGMEAGACHLRLLDGHGLGGIEAECRADGALHWAVLRYAGFDLAPGETMVLREERLRLPAHAVDPLAEGVTQAAVQAAPLAPVRPAPVFLGDRVLAHTQGGRRIYLVPDDVDLTPAILEHGHWELHVDVALRSLLKPGMRVADVGANIGYHTLVMADAVGERGHVDAFEADPRLQDLLAGTIAVNGLAGRVALHRAAVADAPGTLVLATAAGHMGSGHVLPLGIGAQGSEAYSIRQQVPAITLDAALGDAPPLDLLRMDIEGAEPLALMGARGLLARSPALRIVMEWSVPMMRARMEPEHLVRILTDQGFRFWLIEPGSGGFTPLATAELPQLGHSDVLVSRQDPP